MKVVEITPRDKAPLYAILVKREAEIRRNGRGTFARSGRKKQGASTWKHKRFKGSVNLQRGPAEIVRAKVRSSQPEDEGQLLKAFLGFIDRHCGGQVRSITIHYDSRPASRVAPSPQVPVGGPSAARMRCRPS